MYTCGMAEVIDVFPAFEALMEPVEASRVAVEQELQDRISHLIDGEKPGSILLGDYPTNYYQILELARDVRRNIGGPVLVTHHGDMVSEAEGPTIDYAQFSGAKLTSDLQIRFWSGTSLDRSVIRANNGMGGRQESAEITELTGGRYVRPHPRRGGPFYGSRTYVDESTVEGVRYKMEDDGPELSWDESVESVTARGFRKTELLLGMAAIQEFLERPVVNDEQADCSDPPIPGSVFYNAIRMCLRYNNELIPTTAVTTQIYEAELARMRSLFDPLHDELTALTARQKVVKERLKVIGEEIREYNGIPSDFSFV
jgi:hypothetical protein